MRRLPGALPNKPETAESVRLDALLDIYIHTYIYIHIYIYIVPDIYLEHWFWNSKTCSK